MIKSWVRELTGPEYRGRHLFTARLRLAIFLGFWILYIYFYRDVLPQMKGVTLVIAASFLVTSLSYYWILKNRFLIPSFISELVADLVVLTCIVYITDGPYSDFFTIYIFYTFAAGIFYNYLVGLVVGCACFFAYALFLFLAGAGIVHPLIFDWQDKVPITAHTPPYHLLLIGLFLLLAVYGAKIASYFSQVRERMLEARNKELTALNKMSSTIRSTIDLNQVLDQVLAGIREGLELDLPVLALFDLEGQTARFLAPRGHAWIGEARRLLGGSLQPYHYALHFEENSLLQTLKRHQMAFRKNLTQVLDGVSPAILPTHLDGLQRQLGIQKILAIPLVAEEKLLGALVGLTKSAYIDDSTVTTLLAFADQASLSIEAALLIERLKKANEDLREANRVKSEFLATMSHELRTPLTAIIGFSELLLEGVMGKMTEEQMDSVREVLNNGAILLGMINDLLDMAKVEAGKMPLEVAPFDLSEMISRISQNISSLIQKRGHELQIHVQKPFPPIEADEKKVQQILLNLLSNAIKFTPDGGRITLNLKYYNRSVDAMSGDRWASRVKEWEVFSPGIFELSVADTGVGIRPEHLSKVFDMFQQLDSTVTRSYGGTGLGLALAKQFVELHQGVIWVESEYGKGTRFTFLLPAKTPISAVG